MKNGMKPDKKNIFEPDWSQIIQSIYQNTTWVILGVIALGLWAFISKFDPLGLKYKMNVIFSVSLYFLMAFGAFSLFFFAWKLIKKIRGKEVSKGNLDNIIDRHFANQTIIIDGKHYINCIFENCTIVHDGGEFKFTNVQNKGSFKIQLSNQASVYSMMLFNSFNMIVKNEKVISMFVDTDENYLEHGFPRK